MAEQVDLSDAVRLTAITATPGVLDNGGAVVLLELRYAPIDTRRQADYRATARLVLDEDECRELLTLLASSWRQARLDAHTGQVPT
jgi:hypothetical protein